MATTLQPSKDKIVDDLKSLISDAEEQIGRASCRERVSSPV